MAPILIIRFNAVPSDSKANSLFIFLPYTEGI